MYVQWQRRAEQYSNLMILCSCVVELTLRDPRGSFRGQKDNNVGEQSRADREERSGVPRPRQHAGTQGSRRRGMHFMGITLC